MVEGRALTGYPPPPQPLIKHRKRSPVRPHKTWDTVCNTCNRPIGLILGRLLRIVRIKAILRIYM
jgi:hypothetical protein